MKKLLLILAFPCLLAASDKSTENKDEQSTAQKIAIKAVETAHYTNAAYRGIKLGAAIVTGDLFTIGAETLRTVMSLLSTSSATATAVEIIAPKTTETPLQKASRESNIRAAIKEEQAGAALRLCLSEHAHCPDVNAMGIPTRCNSPARDFAMINRRETDLVIANYVKFTEQRRRSI